jgi:hypothetical protein
MNRWWLLAGLALVACGGQAELGEACETASATTEECVDGAVCTNESGGGFVCRKLCTEQSQCAGSEACNGISGSGLKSCQPK